MELYIKGIGCISPQRTFDNSVFLPEVKEYATNKMLCVDADYSKFFDAGSIRRMTRLAKFGTASALIALKDANVTTPGAISTGTGFGLLENSEKFLKSMIDMDEGVLSPTAFIQSTHNTVSSAIALITGCNAHNNTFAHKGFSFESTLTDARLIMGEGKLDNVLVGAYDEISEITFAIMKRHHVYRTEPCSNLEIYKDQAEGVIGGEGGAFFVLSQQKGDSDYGIFVDNATIYRPAGSAEVKEKINGFLKRNNIGLSDIDVVVTGLSGDKSGDEISLELNKDFFNASTIVGFKHLCGEYMTASSFAFWMASQMLKTQEIPSSIVLTDKGRKPKNILLYNQYKNNHSLMLFRAC